MKTIIRLITCIFAIVAFSSCKSREFVSKIDVAYQFEGDTTVRHRIVEKTYQSTRFTENVTPMYWVMTDAKGEETYVVGTATYRNKRGTAINMVYVKELALVAPQGVKYKDITYTWTIERTK